MTTGRRHASGGGQATVVHGHDTIRYFQYRFWIFFCVPSRHCTPVPATACSTARTMSCGTPSPCNAAIAAARFFPTMPRARECPHRHRFQRMQAQLCGQQRGGERVGGRQACCEVTRRERNRLVPLRTAESAVLVSSRRARAPFRGSLLRSHRRAADGLVLRPVQRPVLRGAVPHGATRGTAFVLLHGRLPLVARRQGAVLEACFATSAAHLAVCSSTVLSTFSDASNKPRSRRICTIAADDHFDRKESTNIAS